MLAAVVLLLKTGVTSCKPMTMVNVRAPLHWMNILLRLARKWIISPVSGEGGSGELRTDYYVLDVIHYGGI